MDSIQIEKASKSTSYESYYKKKISFNIGEPLRSLPNGVCDEIRNNNGQWELVRKIGKVILDGSENWNLSDGDKENTIRFSMIPQIPFKISTEAISDKFPYYQNTGNNVECFTVATDTRIHIRIARSKLNVANVQGFKEWLSQNPTTVYYELETPIVTPIEPIEFEVKPLATMTINSEIAPTSNHKVILNRAGQIEQGIVQIAELKSRVDALETAYDSYLLETQHKLSILGFEY